MKHLAALATLLGSAFMATAAFAEGGYYAGTMGARASGRGGAFTARADDLSAVSFNPAGLAKLDATLIQLGNESSYNTYTFTRAEALDYGNPDPQTGAPPLVVFDKVKNSQPWQILDPMVGAASKLGLKNWGFGLAAFAPPGISKEEYPLGGGQRYMMVGREAIILAYAASAAWKYQDIFGVGATAEWIHVPRLNYSLVIDGSVFARAANPVSSSLDMLATMKGSSTFTFNAILGAWYRPMPFLEFGLSGQVVPTSVVTHSTLSVTPLGSAVASVGLTRDGSPANDVTLTLPLPMLFRSGVRYRHLAGAREIYDLELDVEYETWSRVKNFTIDTHGLQANVPGQAPINIDRIVIDKHWRDTVAVKLGGDYAVMPDRLTLRAGGYYETAVADPAYANVDFPGGPQVGGALGASIFHKRFELAVAYQLRVQTNVSTSEANARVYQQVPSSACQAPYTDAVSCNPNFLGQPSPAINAGTYNASSHFVAINVLYRH
jgi:long-chain fatty acid transport protein